MNDAITLQEIPITDIWHAPPSRAIRLNTWFYAGILALVCLAAAAIPLFAMDDLGLGLRIGLALAAVLLGGGLGAFIGSRLRHQRWKLDAEGLWLQTGKSWWKETRVPISRVQHVDLKHGPLERRAKLSTLVVHTAAIHLSGVTVRGIPEAEAETLRDTLARQLDDAADAL